MRKMKRFPVLATLLTLAVFARIFPGQPLRSQDGSLRLEPRAARDERLRSRLDSLSRADSAYFVDSLMADEAMLFYPIDTMRIPDSLEQKDSFRYKYFIALRDSATLAAVRDSLLARGDSAARVQLDSVWALDSAARKQWLFEKWYWSLSKKQRKEYDREQRLAARNAEKLARLEARDAYNDSVRQVRDSIRDNTPRILETWALPDSMQYRRLVMWTLDRRFDDLKLTPQDTSYNYHYPDYSLYRDDVNATWLGVSGSPAQTHDWFKRRSQENAFFYTPYLDWTYTPETLPQYNTKTPYTELWYSGTLFNGQEKEDLNVGVLASQNITPALNLTLGIYRYGAKGYLQKEETMNRTAHVGLNYLGKRYLMHAGFIYNHVERSENGGAIDDDPRIGINWVKDTTVDAREIPVNLSNASSAIKRYTVFLDQSFRFPMSFFSGKKEESDDELQRDVTSAFIGHSSEFSVYRRTYKDVLSTAADKAFYPNNYINPRSTSDSLRNARLENRIYLRLQPWKSDAIVSKVDVGIGDKFLCYYLPSPEMYLSKTKDAYRNSVYAYAAVKGQFKKYFEWDANGRYNFAGSAERNDFSVDAGLRFNLYPFRKARNSPMSFVFRFDTKLQTPDLLMQHYYTNHYRWDNAFRQESVTRFTGGLEIPYWNLDLHLGYGLLANTVYFGSDALPAQHDGVVNVFSIDLRKDFILWWFHLENRLLAQFSTNNSVMPLPHLSANLRWYFQFPVVKQVMDMQVGVNAWYMTSWHMPAYNPSTGVFFNQTDAFYGNTPILDIFLNVQWKRCCVYIKYENANMGWPMRQRDYFSAAHYIRTQSCVKVGIFWPFYIGHIPNPSIKK